MKLDKKEIARIENFKTWDRFNNIAFIILLTLIIIFIIANITAIYKLSVEYNMSSRDVLSLLNHQEFCKNMQWYETHIIRRLGYVIMGIIIALFFPVFYIMGREEMKIAAKCYDILQEKEESGTKKDAKDKAIKEEPEEEKPDIKNEKGEKESPHKEPEDG